MGTYSLWLPPEGAARDTFAAIIEELAGVYGGPRFSPHITLLGSLQSTEDEIVLRAEQIAQEMTAQHVEFDGIGMEDVFFRTLYAIVRPTPALTAANDAARHAFGVDSPDAFMPHLSLLYGLDPPETKQAIVESLQGRLPAACEVRAVEVYQTEQPVESWRLVRRIDLTGS